MPPKCELVARRHCVEFAVQGNVRLGAPADGYCRRAGSRPVRSLTASSVARGSISWREPQRVKFCVVGTRDLVVEQKPNRLARPLGATLRHRREACGPARDVGGKAAGPGRRLRQGEADRPLEFFSSGAIRPRPRRPRL